MQTRHRLPREMPWNIQHLQEALHLLLEKRMLSQQLIIRVLLRQILLISGEEQKENTHHMVVDSQGHLPILDM